MAVVAAGVTIACGIGGTGGRGEVGGGAEASVEWVEEAEDTLLVRSDVGETDN